jgi:ssDNA-binding Zn-finger/Zn-ribbon topoisomerase 1/uncharacterized coiled-coil DUF342 family protein
MSKRISQIATDIFVKAKSGEDLPSKLGRLRTELRKATENDDAVLGKIRGLLDSFKDVIPDEKQRYHAAIKALSTTAKLSPQEIVKAVGKQLEELKTHQKDLLEALPNWRMELKALEVRAKQVKEEMAKLGEKIAKLESEEQGLAAAMATREKEAGQVEKAVQDIFTELGAEIAQIRSRIEEYAAAETPAASPAKKETSAEKKAATAQKIEVTPPPLQQDTNLQRKCPMCGGQMNLHAMDRKWICYSCAHEEPDAGAGPGAGGVRGELTSEPEIGSTDGPRSAPEPAIDEPEIKTKPCPACGKAMHWFRKDKAWRCPSCGYERRDLK